MTTCYTHVQFAFEIPYKKDRGVRVSTQTTSARKVLSIIYRGSHRTESPLDIGCCGHQGPVMTSKELIQFLSHTQQGYSSARRQEKMHSLIVAFMRNELADCRRTEHPVNTRSQRDKPIKIPLSTYGSPPGYRLKKVIGNGRHGVLLVLGH